MVDKTARKRNGEASLPWWALPFLSLSVGVRVTWIVAAVVVAYAVAAAISACWLRLAAVDLLLL